MSFPASERFRARSSVATTVLHGLFLISGVAAILYQLIWQRVLLGHYGLHAESVTIVVTGFMAGLGAGSLVGGWLATRRPMPLPLIFALLELAIAAFALGSVPLFRWIGEATIDVDPAGAWTAVLVLLAVPTALMGATLPILTAYAVDRSRNVGMSVGFLYAVNTLGSACGALLAVMFLADRLGQQGTVALAAGLNLFVGVAVLGASWWGGRK